MVESLDAGAVQGRFSYNHMVIWFRGEVVFAWLSRWMQVKSRGGVLFAYGHLVPRCNRICMAQSLDAGGIQGKFFIIIWSFGYKAKSSNR